MIKTILALIQQKQVSEDMGLSLIKTAKTMGQGNTKRPFKQTFTYGEPYLEGHKVFGEQVLLGVTHISLAIESFKACFPAKLPVVLDKVMFVDPVILPKDTEATIATALVAHENSMRFSVEATRHLEEQVVNDTTSSEAAKGQINFATSGTQPAVLDLDAMVEGATNTNDGAQAYQILGGIEYTPAMQTLQKVYTGDGYSLAKLEVSEEITQHTHTFTLHPALLDGAILSVLSQLVDGETKDTFIPLFIKQLTVYTKTPTRCWCVGRIEKTTDELLTCAFDLTDEDGNVTARVEGVSCKKVADVGVLMKNSTPQPIKPATPKPIAPTKTKARNLPTMELKEHITTYITEKLKSSLGEDGPIDLEKNYMDLGMESSMLIEIANEIETEISIELYPTLFFEYQCVAELSSYFYENFPEAFANYLNIEGAMPVEQITPTIQEIPKAPAPKQPIATAPRYFKRTGPKNRCAFEQRHRCDWNGRCIPWL